MTITAMGQRWTATEKQLVEAAFQAHGIPPHLLGQGFIDFWLKQGKSVPEILAIAGWSRES